MPNEELGRWETHYTTVVRLIQNMLEEMPEYRVRGIVENALEEAIEIHNQK